MDRNNNNNNPQVLPLANPHGSSPSFPVAPVVDDRRQQQQQQQQVWVKQYWDALLGIVVPLLWTLKRKSPGGLRQEVDNPCYDRDEKLPPPCQLSSSIYYGGQDMIPSSMNINKSCAPDNCSVVNQSALKNDVDSEEFADRGDWWKGSFYY